MKTFYIYNSFALPTAPNHLFFVRKFAKGFLYNGYRIKEISSPNEITEEGFIMLSDQSLYESFGARNNMRGNFGYYIPSALKKIDKLQFIEKIGKKLANKEFNKLASTIRDKKIVVLAWFRENQSEFLDSLGIPIIYTGEFYYDTPIDPRHRKWYDFYRSHKNALPIEFAADIDPSKITKDCTNKKYIVSFVGNRSYKPNWYRQLENNTRNKVVPTPPFISEEERLEIYKNSMISLGLHAEKNIKDAIVNERVFEAVAYGAVCLTDNPYAPKATDQSAIFVKNSDELKEKIEELCSDENKLQQIRQRGFEFARQHGTYVHKAKAFITLAEKLAY